MRCKQSENRKMKRKKGLWSPDEDQKLRDYVVNYGRGSWSAVPVNTGLQRSGKSCRLRWINYLRPGLKKCAFSIQEEETILTLHGLLGNKWTLISQHLTGRTDNEIKNHWHSNLKKRVLKSENVENKVKIECTNSIGTESSSSYMNSKTRNPSFDSSDFSNHSSKVRDQPGPHTRINKLPKVLFADWLSLEEFHGHKSVVCNNGVNNESNYQHALVNGMVSNEDMFHNPMKPDQIFNFSVAEFNIEDFLKNV